MKRIRPVFAMLCCMVAVSLLRCSGPHGVAAGSSSTGNARVTACILLNGNSPAIGAVVRCRPKTYVPRQKSIRSRQPSTKADTTTDHKGIFAIDNVDTGEYFIEVTDNESLAILLECIVSPDIDTIDLGVDTLKQFSAIAGIVDTQGLIPVSAAYIEGLERTIPINSATGAYAVEDLPEGAYTVRLAPGSMDYGAVTVTVGGVSAGDTATIAPVTFARFDEEDYSLWSNSAKILINTSGTGADITDAVYDFPLLVRLDASAFEFSSALADGRDVRFSKSDGTRLRYEIEQWDAAARGAAIWVLADTIRGNDSTQSITMHWGRANAQDFSSGAAVFSPAYGYIGVWHMNQAGAGIRCNSAQDAFHARPARYEGDETVRAVIGFGDRLDADDHDTLGDIDLTDAFTISCWVNPATPKSQHAIVSKFWGKCTDPWAVYRLTTWGSPSGTSQYAGIVTGEDTVRHGMMHDREPVAFGSWTHLAFTFDSLNQRIFQNAQSTTRSRSAPVRLIQNDMLTLLADPRCAANRKFEGMIDEVRISRVARSPEWIRMCHMNQAFHDRCIVIRQ